MKDHTLTVKATDATILGDGSVQITVSIRGAVRDGDKKANVMAIETFTLPVSYLVEIKTGPQKGPRIDIRRDPRQTTPL